MRCPDPGEEAVELAGASRTGAGAPDDRRCRPEGHRRGIECDARRRRAAGARQGIACAADENRKVEPDLGRAAECHAKRCRVDRPERLASRMRHGRAADHRIGCRAACWQAGGARTPDMRCSVAARCRAGVRHAVDRRCRRRAAAPARPADDTGNATGIASGCSGTIDPAGDLARGIDCGDRHEAGGVDADVRTIEIIAARSVNRYAAGAGADRRQIGRRTGRPRQDRGAVHLRRAGRGRNKRIGRGKSRQVTATAAGEGRIDPTPAQGAAQGTAAAGQCRAPRRAEGVAEQQLRDVGRHRRRRAAARRGEIHARRRSIDGDADPAVEADARRASERHPQVHRERRGCQRGVLPLGVAQVRRRGNRVHSRPAGGRLRQARREGEL